MLHRLAEIGMQLAERAAEEALAEPAHTPETATKSRRRGPDPRYVFIRLSRFVRDIIALECRLAAGQLPSPQRKASRRGADPRIPAIRDVMKEVIDTSPHQPSIKAGFHNQLEDLIAQGIAADPDRRQGAESIVLAICEELGLACETANMQAQPNTLVAEVQRIAAAAQATHRARIEAGSDKKKDWGNRAGPPNPPVISLQSAERSGTWPERCTLP
jgi:hypothetical protein